MNETKYRNAVLRVLRETRLHGWVDMDEIEWLEAHPNESLGQVNIDGEFDFGRLLSILEQNADR